MSFYFDLYRAPIDAPPLYKWESNHAEPLGTPEAVRRRIADHFPELSWSVGDNATISGRTSGQADECISIFLRALEPGVVSFLSVDALPPVLRRLMTEFRLNYCCALESSEMSDPFSVDQYWKT